MSKKSKSRGKPFQKGQSGNPAGRPKLPEEVKKMRAVATEDVVRILHKYAGFTREQIKAAVSDAATPVMELMVASIMSKAIQDGDANRWNILMDRTVGKVPNKIDLLDQFKGELSGKSLDELAKLAKDILAGLQ